MSSIKWSLAAVVLLTGCAPAAIGSSGTAAKSGPSGNESLRPATSVASSPTTQATGAFARIASMSTLRTGHTATLLADGRVLIAAGVQMQGGTTTELESAETFDPGSGTFSPTGSLTTSRSVHAAALLADGRVLVVGGTNFRNGSFTAITSAETYDPGTGEFSSTGPLATSRTLPTATLLTDGRVLIAGGSILKGGTTTALASAELFDPRTNTFSSTGPMTTSRFLDTATLLDDGRVLIVGGFNPISGAAGPIGAAELYDPRTGTFSQTGSLLTPRFGHTATLLTDGRILVAGGADISSGVPVALASAELFDPRTNTFSSTGSMAAAHAVQSAARLANGQVLVVGGADLSSGSPIALATAELFDAPAGVFLRTASMTSARESNTITALADGTVLITGGDSVINDVQTGIGTAELFRP